MGNPDENIDFWLGQTPVVTAIWGVNQWMDDFSPSASSHHCNPTFQINKYYKMRYTNVGTCAAKASTKQDMQMLEVESVVMVWEYWW